jgi:pimeloyl-ACP methyl ester carboxylesterase
MTLGAAGKGGTVLLAGAVALAAAAVWNNVRARRAERDHSPRGRFLEVDGVRLHYLERGAGPSVVLLHGNVVTAEDYLWSGVLDRVAERHRVVAIDRPGFGYSDRPKGRLWTPQEQAALLRHAFARLGLDRPVVVGHSWGTLVALALALDHPEAVRGLVLLSGYYRPSARIDVPLVAPPAIPVVGAVLRHTVSPLLGRALLPLNLKAMFLPLPVPTAFERDFPRGFPVRPEQIRAEAQDAVAMVPAVAALQQRYRELRLPVVIMAGSKDRIVGVDGHAVRFHQAIPGSELQVIPEAGHMFHYAVPERVAAAIAAVADGRRTGEPDLAGTPPTGEIETRPAA